MIGKIDTNAGYGMKIVLDDGAFAPARAHETDAGLDLRTPCEVTVPAKGAADIDTGVHVAIPVGYAGFLKSKSGLNVKHGIVSEGVIDSGYTGSIRVKLYNHSDTDYTFKAGDKITQLVILGVVLPPLVLVNSLEDTERGDGGFGSTGR
jgi:dUTP pyrophosphatase